MIATALCYIPTRPQTPNIATSFPFGFFNPNWDFPIDHLCPNWFAADDGIRTRDLRTTNAVTTIFDRIGIFFA